MISNQVQKINFRLLGDSNKSLLGDRDAKHNLFLILASLIGKSIDFLRNYLIVSLNSSLQIPLFVVFSYCFEMHIISMTLSKNEFTRYGRFKGRT